MEDEPRIIDIRIPLLALGPVPGIDPAWWRLFGRGRRRSILRWSAALTEVIEPYRWIARTCPDVELMLTLPATAARRVNERRADIQGGITWAVANAFIGAACVWIPPSRVTVTITYDTATVHPHGDAALCMRKELTP